MKRFNDLFDLTFSATGGRGQHVIRQRNEARELNFTNLENTKTRLSLYGGRLIIKGFNPHRSLHKRISSFWETIENEAPNGAYFKLAFVLNNGVYYAKYRVSCGSFTFQARLSAKGFICLMNNTERELRESFLEWKRRRSFAWNLNSPILEGSQGQKDGDSPSSSRKKRKMSQSRNWKRLAEETLTT